MKRLHGSSELYMPVNFLLHEKESVLKSTCESNGSVTALNDEWTKSK